MTPQPHPPLPSDVLNVRIEGRTQSYACITGHPADVCLFVRMWKENWAPGGVVDRDTENQLRAGAREHLKGEAGFYVGSEPWAGTMLQTLKQWKGKRK